MATEAERAVSWGWRRMEGCKEPKRKNLRLWSVDKLLKDVKHLEQGSQITLVLRTGLDTGHLQGQRNTHNQAFLKGDSPAADSRES